MYMGMYLHISDSYSNAQKWFLKLEESEIYTNPYTWMESAFTALISNPILNFFVGHPYIEQQYKNAILWEINRISTAFFLNVSLLKKIVIVIYKRNDLLYT